MKYLSICSGIEAASAAWEPLGWSAVAFSEIEPFPCAVLAHHWPDVPNLGDMTQFTSWPEEIFVEADVIIGGTPCQAWSVAGLRGGLSDARGNLTLIFVQLIDHADAIRRQHGKPPVIVLYENVPGLLNSRDGAFGGFLGGLAGEDEALVPAGKRWTNAGCVYGPERTIAWRVLDAQWFGLAQRRQRVFVVASAGAVNVAEILFEREGVRRDFAPSRDAGQDSPAPAPRGPEVAGHPTGSIDTRTLDAGGINPVAYIVHGIHSTAMTGNGDACPAFKTERARCLDTTGGFATNQGGTVVVSQTTFGGGNDSKATWQEEAMPTLRCGVRNSGTPFVAYGGYRDATPKFAEELMVTLRVGGDGGDNHFVAFGGNNTSGPIDAATARNAHPGGRYDFESETFLVSPETLGVRRITPVESERLQGFPDRHTQISWRDKPLEDCPDGHRQKAIGNSMAVDCIQWLGRRIQAAI